MIGQQGSLGVSPAELLAAKNMASGKSDMNKEISLGGDLTRLMLAAMQLKKSQAELEKLKLTQGANPQTTVAQDVQQGIAQLQGQDQQPEEQPQGPPQGQPPQQMAQMDTGIGGLPAGAMDNEDAFAGGGIVAFAGPDGSGPVESKTASTYGLTNEQKEYLAETDKLAGLPPGTSYRQIQVESSFNPKAVSPAGAQGLAQFMPATLQSISEKTKEKLDPFNPQDSLKAHRFLMTENMNRYRDPVAALTAYNGGTDEKKWNTTKENREYAPKILSFLTASGNANAANTAPPAKTGIANAPQSNAVEGSPLAAAGIATTAAAAGTPAALRALNASRRAADIAKLAGGQPIPPGSVVPSSAMRPPVTVGSLAKQVIPTKVGIGSLGTAGLIGAAGYDIASNVRDTPTSEFYRRLGIAEPDYSPDDSALTQIGQEAKTLGVRGLGALEEGLSTLTGGYYGQARGFKRPQAASTTAPTAPPAPPAPTAAPRAAPAAEAETAAKKPSMLDEVNKKLLESYKNEKPPETLEEYNRRHEDRDKKLGVDPGSTKRFFEDQAKSLTEQAAQARQDKNVDVLLAAAQGFFAMAGGMSPYAMKNFADGLNVGTTQVTAALQNYSKYQREINKSQRELDKLQLATNMGHAEKGSEREDKHIAKIEGFKIRQQQGLQQFAATLTAQGQTQEEKARRMTETERYNKAKEEAKEEDQRRQNLALWGKYQESEEYRKLLNDIKKAGTDPAKLAAANRALMDKKAEYLGSGGGQSAGASSKSTWGKPEIIKP